MAKFLSFITLIPLDMLSTFKFPPLKILERSISCSWIMPSFDLDLSLTFSRKKLPSKTSTILLYTAFVIVVLPIPPRPWIATIRISFDSIFKSFSIFVARESTPIGYLETNKCVRFNVVLDIHLITPWINLDSRQLPIT